jgi:hypothetical protein
VTDGVGEPEFAAVTLAVTECDIDVEGSLDMLGSEAAGDAEMAEDAVAARLGVGKLVPDAMSLVEGAMDGVTLGVEEGEMIGQCPDKNASRTS